MSVKLIALDIDGTLLTSQNQVQEETIAAIKKAQKAGIKIVLTTGRPLISTEPYFKMFGLDGDPDQYMILYHGSIIRNGVGKKLVSNTITLDQVKKGNEVVQNIPGVDFIVQTADQMYLTKNDSNWYTAYESYKNHYPVHYRTIEQLAKEDYNYYKMMFSGAKEKLDEIQAKLPEWTKTDVRTIRSELTYIDMLNKQSNKGWALKKLISILHVDPENIMAIGDGNTDIPMIEFAKYGIAMGNGVQALKDAAYAVTSDNNHAGVAEAIEKYCL